MNREIKFRAWDKSEDKMSYSDTEMFDDMVGFRFDHFGIEVDTIDDIELMQFTGLKDKNGKEIYEGDIVQHGYKIHTGTFIYTGYVHYATDKAMFYITQLGKEQFNDCAITHNNINGKGKIFEVIGNIYENPELLKV